MKLLIASKTHSLFRLVDENWNCSLVPPSTERGATERDSTYIPDNLEMEALIRHPLFTELRLYYPLHGNQKMDASK